MFLIFTIDGSASSLSSSLGTELSGLNLLYVLAVAVSMVFLTLMCICSKKTVNLNHKSENLSASDATISKRLSVKAAEVEVMVVTTDSKNLDNGAVTTVDSSVPVTGTKASMKEQKESVIGPSPSLPPRNIHGSSIQHATSEIQECGASSSSSKGHGTLIFIEESTSAGYATVGITPGDSVSVETAAGPSASSATAPLLNHSTHPCKVQPQYEEVDLSRNYGAPSNNSALDDSNIYQDIDLNNVAAQAPQISSSKATDSIQPYAEFKECKRLSDSLSYYASTPVGNSSVAKAPSGSRSATDIPGYAVVDKSKKSRPLTGAPHVMMQGVEQEARQRDENLAIRPKSMSSNLYDIYTKVHKPDGSHVDRIRLDNKPNLATREFPGGQGCALTREKVEISINDKNSLGNTSGMNMGKPSFSDDPGYSTITDNLKCPPVKLEPGYTSIKEMNLEMSGPTSVGKSAENLAENSFGNTSGMNMGKPSFADDPGYSTITDNFKCPPVKLEPGYASIKEMNLEMPGPTGVGKSAENLASCNGADGCGVSVHESQHIYERVDDVMLEGPKSNK